MEKNDNQEQKNFFERVWDHFGLHGERLSQVSFVVAALFTGVNALFLLISIVFSYIGMYESDKYNTKLLELRNHINTIEEKTQKFQIQRYRADQLQNVISQIVSSMSHLKTTTLRLWIEIEHGHGDNHRQRILQLNDLRGKYIADFSANLDKLLAIEDQYGMSKSNDYQSLDYKLSCVAWWNGDLYENVVKGKYSFRFKTPQCDTNIKVTSNTCYRPINNMEDLYHWNHCVIKQLSDYYAKYSKKI